MPEAIILQGITVQQFEDSLRKIVKEELANLQPAKINLKYLSREEACDLLKISLPTLDDYIRKGLIKGNRIGTRVLFSEEDIQAALQEIPTQKYKRR